MKLHPDQKAAWKIMHRWKRCILRAQRERGHVEQQFMDMMIYGTGFYTPEQQQQDLARAQQLMEGLKP